MGFDAIDRQFRRKEIKLECECCGHTNGIEMEHSRTMYPFDGEPSDPANPNRDVALCRACAAEHHAYWNDMWNEYHAMIR